MTLTFNRELNFTYGRVSVLTPMVRRVVAQNPSAFTFKGTGTYIIGRGEVAVIDPGPLDEEHVAALLHVLKGETVTHILITHTHRDHSPAVRLFQPETDAPTYGYGPHGGDRNVPKVEEGADFDFRPDITVKDGDIIEGKDWTIEAVHTPGHTSNHLCFSFREESTLFSGDQVMGWSTTVVSQPDGDMADYMASLEKLLQRDEKVYWPTHGTSIENPKEYVTNLLAHRHGREDQIAACLADGKGTIESMVDTMYVGLDPRLYNGAKRSVQSHLIHMIETGRVVSNGSTDLDAVYSLAD